MSANKSIVLITGANTGIGFEVVKAMLSSASEAYHLLLSGRSKDKVDAAVAKANDMIKQSGAQSEVEPLYLDIESDEQIQQAAEHVKSKFGRLDALVNNAGGSLDQTADAKGLTKRELWNQSWNLNVSSPWMMTEAFAPLLLASPSARLLFVTSGTASLAEAAEGHPKLAPKPAAGWPKEMGPFKISAYRSSKTGLNMAMLEWVRIFHNDTQVKVFAISPGFLATNLGGADPAMLAKMGAGDPALGGTFIKDVVDGKHDHRHGKVIRSAIDQPW